MTRTILRRFLDHPARRWGIIIAILGIGLTTVLPAADELSRSRRDRAQLEEDSSRMRREVAVLEDVRREAIEKQQRLRELEARAVTAEQVPLFRQEIVDWVRKAGCQVRRIRLEPPRSQQWQEADSSESTSARRKKPESPYVLRTQSLSVSVSGALPEVKRLLTQVYSTDRLVQCRKFSVSPSRDSRKEVVLNVELMLFDLSKAGAQH